jgi:D-alanyl-D-alanine endopeptidase (penicillin-binding protein 7)
MLSLALVTGAQAKAKARKHKEPISTPAAYAIWDLDSKQVIADKNIDAVRSMASITKLMTVLVTLEKNFNLNEALTVVGTQHSYYIKPGMTLSRLELIKLALVGSDNLAAHTLSVTSGVTGDEFIALMNSRARDLEMNDTFYRDPTGLDANNVSTIKDIKTLTEHTARIPVFNEAAATKTLTVYSIGKRDKIQVIKANNTNSFVGKLDISAAKTGFTNAAGRCLTMLFSNHGKKYLLVVLGAATPDQRQRMVASLVDRTNHL